MNKSKQLNQTGMVSIIVTLIMMIVITLIIIGFSQVARRNQQEALDRQLSSQAFYAAESGINDVIGRIALGRYDYVNDRTDYNSCSDPAPTGKYNFIVAKGLTANANLNSAANIGYTCLLVTPNLNPVRTQVDVGSNKVVHMKPSTPLLPTKPLVFTWKTTGDDSADSCPASTSGSPNSFTPFGVWATACDYGILRFDLYDATAFAGTGPGVTAADAANGAAATTAGAYIVPSNAAAGGSSRAEFGKPNIFKASCSAGTCKASIRFDATLTDFYVRVSALYKGLGEVSIASSDGSTFTGAGVQIDSTGKAQDILRRIQVQIPLTTPLGLDVPANALSSTDAICKRFIIIGPGSDADPSSLCRP